MKFKQTIKLLTVITIIGFGPMTTTAVQAKAQSGLKKEMQTFLQKRGIKLSRVRSVSNNTGSTSPVYGSVDNITGEADLQFRGRNLHLSEAKLLEASGTGVASNVIRFEQDGRREASILQFELPKLASYKTGQSFALKGGNYSPSNSNAIIRFAYGKLINSRTAIVYVTGDNAQANGRLDFVSESSDKVNAVFNASVQIYKIKYNLRNGKRRLVSKGTYKIANGRFNIPKNLP